uniref:PilN domain-containing protein n=1 Tax=Chamaesiphon sp. OTE_20_metabat_361 TaxID=2964689 RepID=UPI0037BEB4DB
MYSIDINLLRERTGDPTGQQSEFITNTNITPTAKYGKVPLFVGIGVAALSLLATGGGWLFLGQQATQLEAKQKDLDQKLGSLKVQDARLAELNGQLTQITDRTQSLASVFNQVQPWSAMLQDLRESIPQGVQIASVVQSEVKGVPAPVAPAAAPAPPSGGLIAKVSTPPNPEASPKPGTTPAAATPAPAGTAPAAPPVASTTPVAT